MKRILLGALGSGRLPHAFLFYGGDGVGKDAMALELARVIHCEKGGEEACGVCASCVRIDSMQHPDVRLVVALPVGSGEQSDDLPLAKLPEADVKAIQEQFREKGRDPYYRISIPKAGIIKINSIREVRRESSVSTFDGRKRVFVISQADAMSDTASNTLLKTLEEPSGDCMLILTTSNRDALLPTILSRCQSVRFEPLTEEEIKTALVERTGAEAGHAALLARLANGSYTNALELLNDDVLEQRNLVLSFVRNAVAGKVMALSDDIEKIVALKERSLIARFLVLVLMWFRDAMVLSHGGTIINVDQKEELTSFVTRFPGAQLLNILADVEKAISLVERNVYHKLVLLQLSTQIKANIKNAQ